MPSPATTTVAKSEQLRPGLSNSFTLAVDSVTGFTNPKGAYKAWLWVTNSEGALQIVGYTEASTEGAQFEGCTGGTGTVLVNAQVVQAFSTTLLAMAGRPSRVSLPQTAINVAPGYDGPDSGIAYVWTTAGVQAVSFTATNTSQLLNCAGGTGEIVAGNPVVIGIQTVGASSPQTLPGSGTYTLECAENLSFPSHGTLGVLTSAGFQLVTYTGLQRYAFTGCCGGSGRLPGGGLIVGVLGTTTTGSSPQSLSSPTLMVASTENFPETGTIAVMSSSGGFEFITYTGLQTLPQPAFLGCKGGGPDNFPRGNQVVAFNGVYGPAPATPAVVQNYTQLRSLPAPAQGATVEVLGANALGDGGDGVFMWDQNTPPENLDDNAGIVLHSFMTPNGRWRRTGFALVTNSKGEQTDAFSDAVNVKWFGASGNGITDDSAAIQAAVDALSPIGGTLYFPSGTYLATGPLANRSDQTIIIRGDGADVSVWPCNEPLKVWLSTISGSWLVFQGSTDGFHITTEVGEGKLIIRDIGVLGSGSGSGTGISAPVPMKDRLLENVVVANWTVGVHWNVQDSSIFASTIVGCETGINFTDNSSINGLYGVDVEACGTGIDASLGGMCLVDGATIQGCTTGLKLVGTIEQQHFKNIWLENNLTGIDVNVSGTSGTVLVFEGIRSSSPVSIKTGENPGSNLPELNGLCFINCYFLSHPVTIPKNAYTVVINSAFESLFVPYPETTTIIDSGGLIPGGSVLPAVSAANITTANITTNTVGHVIAERNRPASDPEPEQITNCAEGWGTKTGSMAFGVSDAAGRGTLEGIPSGGTKPIPAGTPLFSVNFGSPYPTEIYAVLIQVATKGSASMLAGSLYAVPYSEDRFDVYSLGEVTPNAAADSGKFSFHYIVVGLGNLPVVARGLASAIAQTTATLNATVNPNGETVSDCHFEYGTTESYGSSVRCTSPGSGESPVAVSAPVASLSEGTTYHFRLVATNASGESVGEDQKFSTLPCMWIGAFSGSAGRDTMLVYDSQEEPGEKWWLEAYPEWGAHPGVDFIRMPLTVTDGFGYTAGDRTWIGRFSGAGNAELLCFSQSAQNWGLGTFADTSLSLVPLAVTDEIGYTAGDPTWIGRFSGAGNTELLCVSQSSQNWGLGTVTGTGTFTGTSLFLMPLAVTGGFRYAVGDWTWVGQFSGAGNAELLCFSKIGQKWWLGTVSGTSLSLMPLAVTGEFGCNPAVDPTWIGQFSGTGNTELLCFSVSGQNWWLGTVSGASLSLMPLAVTGVFEYAAGDPSWVGQFSGTGNTELLCVSQSGQNWGLGTVTGTSLSLMPLAVTGGFVYNPAVDPPWIGQFSGAAKDKGNAELLCFSVSSQNWWLGTVSGTSLFWAWVGMPGL